MGSDACENCSRLKLACGFSRSSTDAQNPGMGGPVLFPLAQGSLLPELGRLTKSMGREIGEDNADRHHHRGRDASKACAKR